MNLGEYELIIVGSGLYGLTIAERAATIGGRRVLVIDRRDHVGGNAYSYRDPITGIDIHKYGCHIFHTSNNAVRDYVTQFSEWTPYEHRVWTIYKGQIFSLPVNLHTISQFVGRSLTPSEAHAYVAEQAALGKTQAAGTNDSFETRAVAAIGRPLFEAFFKGYTEKQWQTPAAHLPGQVFSRLPVRFTLDNRYFNDSFQALPLEGYGPMLERMAATPGIDLALSTDWSTIAGDVPPSTPVVYSGAVDEYFDYRFGPLTWRTLDFESEIVDTPDFQGAPQVNYADPEIPYTRIHEFVHYPPNHRIDSSKTYIMREFSRFAERGDECYYPVHTDETRRVLRQYQAAMIGEERPIWFGGRLGSFKYLDMHMAIGSALNHFEKAIRPQLEGRLDRMQLVRADD